MTNERKLPTRETRSIRFSPSERRLIETAAFALEKPVSAFVREAALAAARRELANGRAA